MSAAVEVITRWERLARYRDQWSALLARSDANQPMLSPLWLETWWQVFGQDEGRRLCALLVHEHGRLVGIAPLLARRVWYRGAIPLRRIELLATGEPEADEICSEYLGIVAEAGREAQVARAVVGALAGRSLGAWDELVLDVMPALAPMTGQIMHHLRRARLLAEVTPQPPCPYIPLAGTWEAYLARLPSSRRYFLKRTVRDLERWAGDELVLRRAESAAELAEGQRILIDLHGRRWREDGRDGVFSSPRFQRFHHTVMPALLAAGNLDLIWLCRKDEPIAAIYNIVWDGKVYFYQAGRRPDLPPKIRPGIAIHAYAIQHAIERGYTRYDFLSGASRYKKQLSLDEAPLLRVRALRRSLPAMARRWAHTGEDLARALRRRSEALVRQKDR